MFQGGVSERAAVHRPVPQTHGALPRSLHRDVRQKQQPQDHPRRVGHLSWAGERFVLWNNGSLIMNNFFGGQL